MATQDFSPEAGAGGANTSVDGIVEHDIVSGDTWATLHGSAGSYHADTTTSFAVQILAHASNNWRAIDRSIATIDLSGYLGNSAGVQSVAFKIYAYNFSASAGTFFSDISLVGSTPTDPADLANGDYAQLGSAKYAPDVDISSKSTGYYTFNLDATGITAVKTAIDGTGILKLGVRSKPDADNAEPSWEASVADSVGFYSVDYDSGSAKPVLTITYAGDITVLPPVATIDIGFKIPTLKLNISSPVWTVNIEMMTPTISITGAVFTNQAKNLVSITNTAKNSSNWTNQTKNNITFIDQSKS